MDLKELPSVSESSMGLLSIGAIVIGIAVVGALIAFSYTYFKNRKKGIDKDAQERQKKLKKLMEE